MAKKRFCTWPSLALLGVLHVVSTQAWTTIKTTATKTRRKHCDSLVFPLHATKKIQAKRPDVQVGDLTGGRPGAIVETEEQLERKEEIFQELEQGDRQYATSDILNEYGSLDDLEGNEYDRDDPAAIDSSTLGDWDITYLKSKFDYEWDPASGEPDPNLLDPTKTYVPENAKDDDGIELFYDPMFGNANPIDTRTIVGAVDSYMIDEETRDDTLLTPSFPEGDVENEYNEQVRNVRKSLDIIDTYLDPYLPENMPVPRHAAKWHGYPEPETYPQKDYSNNRFTKPENVTPFDDYDPHKARKLAVQFARAKNSEWLVDGVSQAHHEQARAPYEAIGTLVGTLRKGDCDAGIKAQIEPALRVLGNVAELLSIDDQGTVFRFHYHGLMKNKFGMASWTETMIQDCGVECTGVVFETGFRRRDPAYDGGDAWYGPY